MPIINRPGSGGADPTPAPNDTQIYYEYIFDASVIYDTTSTATQNATAPAAGFIRANNANTAIATVFAVANQTFNAQGIGTYMDRQAAGLDLNLRGVNAQQFGVYNMESAPTTGSGHRKFIVTPVNGLALADQDRIALSFTSTGNVKSNPTTGNLETNGVAVAPNILTVDTIAEALSLVTVNAANDRKEFAVLDPGGNSADALLLPIPWNVIVDNTMGILRQINGLSDFAMLKAAGRYCQPAANASARATDSSVLPARTKLTITAHGLAALTTGAGAIDTYVMVQATGGGFTVNEKLKILSIVDANNIVVDKLFSEVSGNPGLYVVTGVMPIGTLLCPPMRLWSQLQIHFTVQMATSANAKTISLNWGGTDYYAPTAFTATKGLGRITMIKNTGATNRQIGFGLTTVNAGTEGPQTAGNVPNSAVNTTVVTTANVNVAIANAADWVELENLIGSARW